MERHAFPADLADDLIKRWNLSVLGGFRRPTLPARAQLVHLLEVAYLTSLETDEGRSLSFTLVCTPGTEAVRRFQQNDTVEAWTFGAPRPLEVQELRRLAVTTDLERSAIWVQFPEGTGESRLRGLLNLGQSWAHAREAFAFHYDALPDALTIRVEGPGVLAAYQGPYAIATLQGGKILGSPLTTEDLHGIHGLLEEGQAHFASAIEGPRHAPPRLGREFAWAAYVNVLLATVNAIKRTGHGGAVILCGRNSRLVSPETGLLRMKYELDTPTMHLAERYVGLVNQRCQLTDLQWKLEEEEQAMAASVEPVIPPLQALRLLYAEVRDANEALSETCGFVGQLAGTDGAIVLRSDLAMLGFGAEIVLEEAAPVPVYEVRSLALSRAELLDSEQFGMRHRSAMRLCATTPDVAVFVVSQDGGVSLVFHANGHVYVRRNIATTHLSMAYS